MFVLILEFLFEIYSNIFACIYNNLQQIVHNQS